MTTYNEIFDVERLRVILSNKRHFKNLIQRIRPEVNFEDPSYDVFGISEGLLKLGEQKGSKSTTYRKPDTITSTLWSATRLYAADPSLQSICREIRNTIAGHLYYDIDMVNSHIVIIEYIARVHLGYTCEFLTDYVINRENKIEAIIKANPDKTREQIKTLILAICYGGSKSYREVEPTKWLTSFYEEVQYLFSLIKDKYPQKYAIAKEVHDQNASGSLLSSMACMYESQLLDIMIAYFKKNKIIKDTCVLCFDGVMVPRGKLPISKIETHLRTIEEEFKIFGIHMKLIIKNGTPLPLDNIQIYDDEPIEAPIIKKEIEQPWEPIMDIALDWKQIYEVGSQINNHDKYTLFIEKLKVTLDANFVMITLQAKSMIIAHTYEDDIISDEPLIVVKKMRRKYMTLSMLKTYFDNKLIYTNYILKGNPITIDPFAIWYKSKDRNEKTHIEFNPSAQNIAPYYNLWHGYRITREMCTDVEALTIEDPLLHHIYKRWAKYDINVYNYIMGWMATTIQNPGRKLNSCIVLRGKEGAAKGKPFAFLQEIMGDEYVFQPGSPNAVLGEFNSSLEGTKLLFMDELVWGGDKQKAGILKKLVTETHLDINRKHMPSYSVKNLLNICMSSNDDWVVPAGLNARRYLICDVDNELAGTNLPPNAKRSLQDILNTNVLRFAKTLYNWDISNFDDRNPPQTEGLRIQKMLTFGPIDKYWHTCLVNGYVSILRQGIIREYRFGSNDTIPKEEMYEEFIRQNNNNRYTSSVQFWINIHKICTNLHIVQKRIDQNRRTRCIRLPNLQDAREQFRNHVADPNWHFPDILEEITTDEEDL
jgi:hypothetical protein